VLGNEWGTILIGVVSFVGDMGIAFERLDVPLEAKRERFEGFIVFRCREQVESEAVKGPRRLRTAVLLPF